MNTEDYNDEVNTIKHIAIKNGYKSEIVDKIIYKHPKKLNSKNVAKCKTQYDSAIYTNKMCIRDSCYGIQ